MIIVHVCVRVSQRNNSGSRAGRSHLLHAPHALPLVGRAAVEMVGVEDTGRARWLGSARARHAEKARKLEPFKTSYMQSLDMVDGPRGKGQEAQKTCFEMLSPALATRQMYQNPEKQLLDGKV